MICLLKLTKRIAESEKVSHDIWKFELDKIVSLMMWLWQSLIIAEPYVLFITYWAKWSKSDTELRIIWSVNIMIPLHYTQLIKS